LRSHILSVLIVDDELPIREELRLFHWEENGAVLVGEAENGEEAIHFCREYVPDVVITDITMPKMNGIELFRNLKQEFPQSQVIVLTAHSEFHYAQQALQLGALDYLVKVLFEDEEIISALDKARKAIDKERVVLKNKREQLRWQKSEYINQFLKTDTDPKSILNELKSLGIDRSFPLRYAKLFVNAASEDLLFVDRALQKVLDELEQGSFSKLVWIPMIAGEYLLFVDHVSDNPNKIAIILEELVPGLYEGLNAKLPYISSEITIFACISQSVRDENQLWESLRKGDGSKSGFYQQSNVFLAEERHFSTLNEAMIAAIDREMKRSIHDVDQLISFIQKDFYEWASENRIDPDELKGLLLRWKVEWQKVWGVLEQEVEKSQSILEAVTLSQAVTFLINGLKLNRNPASGYRLEIRNAVKMVEQRLSDQLSLASVAEEVELSPNYLSRLFREETGISFNEFVTKMRMEMAVDLLKSTNLKVYEIAEKIGIPSYRYFSAVFRKWTGVTPKEFRKR
jgi:two-component system response regulator YesN